MHRVARIYHSKTHVAVTVLVLLIPFAFLVIFSQIGHLALRPLLGHIGISLVRMFFAYLGAAVLGWVLAVGFFKGRRATVALPIFDVIQSFPTFAALPLATFLWGPSNLTIILFLVITIIWPIFFSLISSLKLMRHDWEEAATIFQLRGFNYLRYFLWPMTVPALITGSIVGLGEGWEALVATEVIVGSKTGLGQFFQSFAHNTPVTIFGIFGFLIIIFVMNKLIWLPLLRWSHERMGE